MVIALACQVDDGRTVSPGFQKAQRGHGSQRHILVQNQEQLFNKMTGK